MKNRERIALAGIALLLLMVFCEPSNMSVGAIGIDCLFLGEMTRNEIKVITDFEKAVATGDLEGVIRLGGDLLTDIGEKWYKVRDHQVKVHQFVIDNINLLGREAKEAFAQRYNNIAQKLAIQLDGSNPYVALEILRLYPFTKSASEARAHLASFHADRGEFGTALQYLVTEIDQSPDFILQHPGLLLLAARCSSKSGSLKELYALRDFMQKNCPDVSENDVSLLAYISDSIAKLSIVKEKGEECYDLWRNVENTPTAECTVTKPVLLWKATSCKINNESTPLNDDLARGLDCETGYSPSVLNPIVVGDKLLLYDGHSAIARDIDTGFLLTSYPKGDFGKKLHATRGNPFARRTFATVCGDEVLFSRTYSDRIFGNRLENSMLFRCQLDGSGCVELFEKNNHSAVPGANILAGSVMLISPPAVYKDLVINMVAETQTNRLFAQAVSKYSGELVWIKELGQFEAGSTSYLRLCCIPIVVGERVIAEVLDKVFCFQAATGEVNWCHPFIAKKAHVTKYSHPVVFEKLGIVVFQGNYSVLIRGLDIATGEQLWEVNAQRVLSKDELYIYAAKGCNQVTIEPLTGRVTSIMSKPVHSNGTLSNNLIYYYTHNFGLIITDLTSGAMLSATELPCNPQYVQQIFPFGDYLFVLAKETIYCFADEKLRVKKLKQKVEENPEDVASLLKLAHFLERTKQFKKAEECIKRLEKIADGSQKYFGCTLKDIINHRYSSLHANAAMEILATDPEEAINQACAGLVTATNNQDKSRLVQTLIATYFLAGNKKEALLTLSSVYFDPQTSGENIFPPLRLVFEKLNIGVLGEGDYRTLHEVIKPIIAHMLLDSDLKEELEAQAGALVLAARQGDEAAQKELAYYFFSTTAMKYASAIALDVLEGRDVEKNLPLLETVGEAISPGASPEVYLARGIACKEEFPSKFDDIAQRISEAYGSRKLLCNKSEKTIADFARALVMYPEKSVASDDDFPNGMVEVCSFISEVALCCSSYQKIIKGPKGYIFLHNCGTDIVCYDIEQRRTVWVIEDKDKSNLGLSFSDSDEKVMVSDVRGGTPASIARIVRGDVVCAINGRAPQDARTLRKEINNLPIDSSVVLEILRGKELLSFRMKTESTRGSNPSPVLRIVKLEGNKIIVFRKAFDKSGYSFTAYDTVDGSVLWEKAYKGDYISIDLHESSGSLFSVVTVDKDSKVRLQFFDPITNNEKVFNLENTGSYSTLGLSVYLSFHHSSVITYFDILTLERVLQSELTRFKDVCCDKVSTRYMSIRGNAKERSVIDAENPGLIWNVSALVFSSFEDTIFLKPLSGRGTFYTGKPGELNEAFQLPQDLEVNGFIYDKAHLFVLGTSEADVSAISRTLSKVDRKTGKIVWNISLPFKENSWFSQFENPNDRWILLVSRREKQRFAIVVDKSTGEIVFLKNIGEFDYVDIVDNLLVLTSSYHGVAFFKPATQQDKAQLLASADEFMARAEDIRQCHEVVNQLIAAKLYDKAREVCDWYMRSAKNPGAETEINFLIGFLKEATTKAEAYVPEHIEAPLVDGKLDEWKGDWKKFPQSSLLLDFDNASFPKGKDDISVRYKFAVSSEYILVAIEATDDVDITGFDHEMGDFPVLFLEQKGARVNSPFNAIQFRALRAKENSNELEFELYHFGNAKNIDDTLIKGAYSRDEESKTTIFEIAVPRSLLGDFKAEDTKQPQATEIYFNLGFFDTDIGKIDKPFKILELYPSLFQGSFSYYNLSIFPWLDVKPEK